MTLEAFTVVWAEHCAEAIRSSVSYRETAAEWEGDLIFVMRRKPPAEDRAVYFDLWHGDCREARLATESDLATARFVIEGSEQSWAQALGGRLAPLLALMTGRMKLTRGNLGELAPYALAARDLLAAVSGLGAEFPGES
jgi:putative sterol carrier protein